MKPDARPFLAHHLRECADQRLDENGHALHLLARWVENLPANDAAMRRIGATTALDYTNGSFVSGARADSLIESFRDDSSADRRLWLARFAEAVEEDLRSRQARATPEA